LQQASCYSMLSECRRDENLPDASLWMPGFKQ
jgi:hypothetical protein